MRRIAFGCTSESHALYPLFMRQFSACIFEWDKDDVELLRCATKLVLSKSGLSIISEDTISGSIRQEELALHCRRRTRGVQETCQAVDQLLESLAGATDALGVPLLRPNMKEIWDLEKKHLPCIQDLEDVPLYTVTGISKKGCLDLPVYRCGRGSTSLENFHRLLLSFVPGTTASSLHFQAYLLDGIVRRNATRSSEAFSAPNSSSSSTVSAPSALRTFDYRLQERIAQLSTKVLGESLLPNYRPPRKVDESHRELIGLEYLNSQSLQFVPVKEVDDAEFDSLIDEDEGFAEIVLPELLTEPADTVQSEDASIPLGFGERGEGAKLANQAEQEPKSDEDVDEVPDFSLDEQSRPGWDKVALLAEALLQVVAGRQGMSASQAETLSNLFDNPEDFDKRALKYKPYYPTKPQQG